MSKRVLVTGGGKGVGAAIVRALAASGHDVDFTYRSSGDAAQALADELQAEFPERKVIGHALDLAEKGSIDVFCEAMEGESFFGLVHNAGQPYDALAAVMAQDKAEAATSLLTIQHGRIPPTINYNLPDPAIPLDVVPNVARDMPVTRVLSNSFGFGGQNTCLVLAAEPK